MPEPSLLSGAEIIAHLAACRELKQHNLDRFPAAAKVRGRLQTDSRRITRDDIFLAIEGLTHDGNNFLAQAVAAGICLFITDKADFSARRAPVPTIVVKNSRRAWSLLCSLSQHQPEQHLDIIGVTGTNGKTSTTWMLTQMLTLIGRVPMLIGGLGTYYAERLLRPNPMTTPDPDLLYRLFAWARRQNITCVVMEVSSHAIALQKVAGIDFKACVFTSFSAEHLDFHSSLADYFASKWQFIEMNRDKSEMIILHAQVVERAIAQGFSIDYSRLWVYGDHLPKLLAKHLPEHLSMQANILKTNDLRAYASLTIRDQTRQGWVNFFGRHFIENFAAALLVGEQLHRARILPEDWQRVSLAPGRMEVISRRNPLVIVDYAHTPAALAASLQELAFARQLWVVFGCGGERDKSKRPHMGEVAARLAHHVVLTNDNPRREEPQAIIAAILQGIEDRSKVVVQEDRFRAIKHAITAAKKQVGGAVLVAGKGCEDYQEVGDERLPYDDRSVCRRLCD